MNVERLMAKLAGLPKDASVVAVMTDEVETGFSIPEDCAYNVDLFWDSDKNIVAIEVGV